MFSSAIVIFRETLEIALILGVVLAATQGVPGRSRWVLLGLAGGVAVSLLVAVFAGAISQAAEGLGQEYFNAGILLAASVMIGWTVIWMKTHARQITQKVRHLGSAVKDGDMPLYSLAVVVTLASLREGSEMVLFTYGLIATGQALWSIGAGSMLGFAGGAAIGWLVYLGLIRIPVRYVFAVTGWLLILLAAGMASLAAKYLASAGMFSSLSEQVWNSSALL